MTDGSGLLGPSPPSTPGCSSRGVRDSTVAAALRTAGSIVAQGASCATSAPFLVCGCRTSRPGGRMGGVRARLLLTSSDSSKRSYMRVPPESRSWRRTPSSGSDRDVAGEPRGRQGRPPAVRPTRHQGGRRSSSPLGTGSAFTSADWLGGRHPIALATERHVAAGTPGRTRTSPPSYDTSADRGPAARVHHEPTRTERSFRPAVTTYLRVRQWPAP